MHGLYGEVVSEVEEDFYVIKDSSEEDEEQNPGANRSGIYSVKVKLEKDIPNLLPMCGKRVKIYYRGVQRLCPICFRKHPKKVCQSRKVSWMDYVKKFIETNSNIPKEFFGKFAETPGMGNEETSAHHGEPLTEDQ